jgi:hypothetical protein
MDCIFVWLCVFDFIFMQTVIIQRNSRSKGGEKPAFAGFSQRHIKKNSDLHPSGSDHVNAIRFIRFFIRFEKRSTQVHLFITTFFLRRKKDEKISNRCDGSPALHCLRSPFIRT